MWKITATHAVWSFAVLENFVNRKLVPMSLISNILDKQHLLVSSMYAMNLNILFHDGDQ